MAKSNFSVSFGIIRFSVFQLVLFCSKIARNGQNSEMPTETVCSLFSWMEWREKMLPQHHPNPNIACAAHHSKNERGARSLARSLRLKKQQAYVTSAHISADTRWTTPGRSLPQDGPRCCDVTPATERASFLPKCKETRGQCNGHLDLRR